MNNAPAVTTDNALVTLQAQGTPESLAIIEYVAQVKAKNIAVLGIDEAFVLQDGTGQIKAFKSALQLSANEGTLIQPTPGGPFVVSAQGYEVWAEKTGTSVIFPKEVLVGTEWKPNPYAERDPKNRRILAVHARAVAFKFSSMGIPQVSDWTTIFDTPSYRMIDLLAKAKKFPQAFKVLPSGMKPETPNNETWASYPFDESMDLFINTSHDEVIKWLGQILNREKKAMDFAQTFAKRNALKHLSGLQRAPGNQWLMPVLAWRPTGNNIVKWDATQYAQLQDRVAATIEGDSSGFGDNKIKQLEIKKGLERASDEDGFEGIEAETDPEDQPEIIQQPEKEPEPIHQPDPEPVAKEPNYDPAVKQAITTKAQFSDEFDEACSVLGMENKPEIFTPDQAVLAVKKTGEILDSQMED